MSEQTCPICDTALPPRETNPAFPRRGQIDPPWGRPYTPPPAQGACKEAPTGEQRA